MRPRLSGNKNTREVRGHVEIHCEEQCRHKWRGYKNKEECRHEWRRYKNKEECRPEGPRCNVRSHSCDGACGHFYDGAWVWGGGVCAKGRRGERDPHRRGVAHHGARGEARTVSEGRD